MKTNDIYNYNLCEPQRLCALAVNIFTANSDPDNYRDYRKLSRKEEQRNIVDKK